MAVLKKLITSVGQALLFSARLNMLAGVKLLARVNMLARVKMLIIANMLIREKMLNKYGK